MRRWITIMMPLVVLAAAVHMRGESSAIVHELRLKVFGANPPGEAWDDVFIATSK